MKRWNKSLIGSTPKPTSYENHPLPRIRKTTSSNNSNGAFWSTNVSVLDHFQVLTHSKFWIISADVIWRSNRLFFGCRSSSMSQISWSMQYTVIILKKFSCILLEYGFRGMNNLGFFFVMISSSSLDIKIYYLIIR